MAIIGIDLGTSTCEIAYFKDGKAQIIKNKKGERITPSYVGIDTNEEIIVGQDAKEQFIGRPKYTVMEVKRLMGTDEMIQMGDKEYRPEEISAMLLKYLKECAEIELGEIVDEAVITVPANFNNLQREATINAARIAGIKVERIINEPTSAALAFGIKNMEKEAKILVYDFGGGTIDVTVLDMFEGIIDVKSSYGNTHLGGKDIDERLFEYIVAKMGDEGFETNGDLVLVSKVKSAAENAKKELSLDVATTICIENVMKDGKLSDFNLEITRNDFEELIYDLIELTGEVIDKAIYDKGFTYEDIDLAIMVGGTTRIPAVRRFVQDKLNKRIKTEVNPDEAVSLGAAIQAAIKTGEMDEKSGLLVTDVCPYNLGVEVVSTINDKNVAGLFSKIIPRNSTIPITISKEYCTFSDNQRVVSIDVYQTLDNECIWVDDAENIGSFELDEIPENDAGKEAITIEFSYDINGNLKVKATINSTGKSEELEIKNNSSLSAEEILNMSQELTNGWEKADIASKYRLTIESVEKKMDQLEDMATKRELMNMVTKLKEFIINENEDMADEMDGKIIDLLFDLE